MKKIYLPQEKELQKTGEVDYFYWNYRFPIKYIQLFRFKAILKLMGNTIYNNLLEVGTGSGIFLPELSKHCNQLYAIDNHNNMDSVRRLCQIYRIKGHVVDASIENTPFMDEMFDAIVAVSVLEFVNDIYMTIVEIQRILKPDGYFFVICPQQIGFVDRALALYSDKNPTEEFFNSRKIISKLLEINFIVSKRVAFPPLLHSFMPIYIVYKLTKKNSIQR